MSFNRSLLSLRRAKPHPFAGVAELFYVRTFLACEGRRLSPFDLTASCAAKYALLGVPNTCSSPSPSRAAVLGPWAQALGQAAGAPAAGARVPLPIPAYNSQLPSALLPLRSCPKRDRSPQGRLPRGEAAPRRP